MQMINDRHMPERCGYVNKVKMTGKADARSFFRYAFKLVKWNHRKMSVILKEPFFRPLLS